MITTVIKLYLATIFFTTVTFAQQSKYPKDTIYVKYENKALNKKWLSDYGYGNNKKEGILFNVKDENNKNMLFFYDKKLSTDTLYIKHLKNYAFLGLKEIEKKEKNYYKNRFGKTPWIKNKNGVFHTYLIEEISKEKFVIYPVIWRNEGAID